LNSKEFAIAATLAEWREQQAKNANIPRRWLLPDEAILELALEPQSLKMLTKRWKVLNKHSDTVSKLINNPIKLFAQMDTGDFEPLNADEKKKLSKLKKYCLSQANDLGLDPVSIANRKTLEKIIRGRTDFLESDNWRHQILLEYVNSNAG
jgi:ribonuclease D